MKKINIILLLKDFRINDNPALWHACCQDLPLLIIYWDGCYARPLGEASKEWLKRSLQDLNKNLFKEAGLEIFCYKKDSLAELLNSLKDGQFDLNNIYYSFLYPAQQENLNLLIEQKFLHQQQLKKYDGNFLFEFGKIEKKFKIFTPFYRHCLGLLENDCRGILAAKPLDRPRFIPSHVISAEEIAYLFERKILNKTKQNLEEINPLWWNKISKYWEIGEEAAIKKFLQFCEQKLWHYGQNRDFMDLDGTSKLSVHLSFGEISVRFIWHYLFKNFADKNIETFLRQLCWREFAYQTWFENPQLHYKPLRAEFENFEWAEQNENLILWQQGKTGFPIIDAAMRCLWETGWMHNRVRMIVGSFLVKNLLLPWSLGEKWFFDCLVDADVAINPFSWQWVAGCGTDSAPYFRIFNPVLQSQKFDAEGEFIRKFVGELKDVGSEAIHQPELYFKNISEFYYKPIVDLQYSRQRALEKFHKLKNMKFI